VRPQVTSATREAPQQGWLPLVAVSISGLIMVFNAAALNTAIGNIVVSLNASVSSVQSAIVAYSLLVAAFTVTGGKLNAVLGPRTTQLAGLAVYAMGTAVTAFAATVGALTLGQVIAGLGAAMLIPNNMAIVLQAYSGRQREVAIIAQAGFTAIGVSFGLMFGGTLVSLRGWRAPFIALLVMQIFAMLLALQLRMPRSRGPSVKIDFLSVALSAAGIVLVIGAVNQAGPWGALTARPAAPISLFGISPAFPMFLSGGLLLRFFVTRQRRLRRERFAPLLAPEVMDSKVTRASMIVSVAATVLFAGAAYVMLLYAEVVVHYSAVWSALFILPLSVAAVAAAVAEPALTRRWQPRLVVGAAFLLAAAATLLLAGKVSNAWSNPALWVDDLIGLGAGVVLAVGSQVLISSVPDSWSSDVGSTQCVTFIGTAFGTSVAGAVLMSTLASTAGTLVDQHANLMLPPSVELSATSVRFVSNDELRSLLSRPPWRLTPEQLNEAVQINIEARLAALRASLTMLALLALAAMSAISSLPGREKGACGRDVLEFTARERPPAS